jgi:hypothetical protein
MTDKEKDEMITEMIRHFSKEENLPEVLRPFSYAAIVRRFLTVEPLPQGAVAKYDIPTRIEEVLFPAFEGEIQSFNLKDSHNCFCEKRALFAFGCKCGGNLMEEDNIIDIETIPFHMRRDYFIRNANIRAGKNLCKRCSGTGNELYSMWKQCQACTGDGASRNNENTFPD